MNHEWWPPFAMVVQARETFIAGNPFRSSTPIDHLCFKLLSTQMALGLECRGGQVLPVFEHLILSS